MGKQFRLYMLAFILSLFACSKNSNLVGNDVETGNPTISGVLVDSTGIGLGQVEVRLVPEDYNIIRDTNSTIVLDTTDSLGQFNFDDPDEGGYNVEGILIGGQSMALIQNVIYLGQNIELEKDTLESLKNLTIKLPEGSNEFNGYIYVPGTSMGQSMNLQAGDSVDINILPSTNLENLLVVDENKDSTFSIEELVNNKDVNIRTIADYFTDVSGEFEYQPYFDWSQSKTIKVMTGNSGIKLTENLYNYPLLVRLNTENFHFSVANRDASDLRITKPNGEALPIQVDHFDPNFETGAVWVLLDTLFAYKDNQIFQMYYGNSNVTFNSKNVFETNDGWAGVWHLNEGASGFSQMSYINSSSNQEHAVDSIISENKDGIIGPGQGFELNDFIQVNNASDLFKPSQTVTLSAWTKIDTSWSGGPAIATMGNNYNFRITPGGYLRFSIWNSDTVRVFVEDHSQDLRDGEWHYVTGIIDGSTIRIYVDGELRSLATHSLTILYTETPDFVFGRHPYESQFRFIGNMDELRVSNVVRTNEWVRTSYENERLNSNLVQF